jgi:hypothetical protein
VEKSNATLHSLRQDEEESGFFFRHGLTTSSATCSGFQRAFQQE